MHEGSRQRPLDISHSRPVVHGAQSQVSTRHPESLRTTARKVRFARLRFSHPGKDHRDDVWRFTSIAAVIVVVTGLLPWDETSDVVRRMAPILVFLIAITVLAGLARWRWSSRSAREAAHLARVAPVLFLW
jgi:undecaprenyl pyrophosphate phosphatase UppP